MTYSEIIKLIDAGYSREEIIQMDDAQNDDAQNDDALIAGVMSEVKEMFADMRKELVAMNIMNSSIAPDNVKTNEDIIANIINPFNREEGDK